MDELFKKNGNKVSQTYSSFQSLLAKVGPPAEPVEIKSFKSLSPANNKTEYDVPTLEQIGMSISEVGSTVKGGEVEGLKRLE